MNERVFIFTVLKFYFKFTFIRYKIIDITNLFRIRIILPKRISQI